MKIYILTAFFLSLMGVSASAATKIVNKTACVLQLFNENNDNAPLTLALNPLSAGLQQSASDQSYPFYMVEEQAIKVNIGAYNTWNCDNYISIYHKTGLTDECVEVYTNILPTTPGESSVPGELLTRPCGGSSNATPPSSTPPSPAAATPTASVPSPASPAPAK
jgi:hypothetical protein